MAEQSKLIASEPSGTLLSRAPERAILVGVDMPGTDWPVEESLDELAQLAATASVTCVDRVIQRLARPHPGTLLGSGKVQEITELLQFHNCDAVLFDLELTPGQHRTLERELETQVLDRTALILIIFGQRAHTKEGRLQVELAQVEYDLPRLARQWSHFSRQKGSVQQRGEGEKQIEVDRRLLRRQKDQLLEELEHVRTHRQLHRERRKSAGAPVVSLVGYTNAGKSTLLNRLAGAGGLPVVVALNKADLVACDLQLALPVASATLPTVRVSAHTGSGIDELLRCISVQLIQRFAALDVLIPYDRGDLVALLHQFGTIEYEGYEEGGTHLRGYIPTNHSGPFAPFAVRLAAAKRLHA